MAKSPKTERLIYCSGPGWVGDGSKASSACPFGHSKQTAAERYKCHHCTTGQTPAGIFADAKGVKSMVPENALEEARMDSTEQRPLEPPLPEPETTQSEAEVEESVSTEPVTEPAKSVADPQPAEDTETSEPPKPKKTARAKSKKRRRPRF